MQYSPISNLLDQAFEQLSNPPRGCPLPWMPKITECIGGLRPHELTLLCAPTGSGKTELLATIAAQLAMTGTKTFVAPVETGDVDFTSRVLSTISKRNLNHGLSVPTHILDELKSKHLNQLSTLPLFIAHYDNRVKISELTTILEFACTQEGCQVALLDNLNFFLEITRAQDQVLEMDYAVHELVMFVKKHPMHIILIVHPKKTDGGRVESEFDIKGSSTAVQECTNVMLFNRPSQEHLEKIGHLPNHREIVFKKIRKRGSYVNKSIWVTFEDGRYSELERIPLAVGSPPKDQRRLSAGRD